MKYMRSFLAFLLLSFFVTVTLDWGGRHVLGQTAINGGSVRGTGVSSLNSTQPRVIGSRCHCDNTCERQMEETVSQAGAVPERYWEPMTTGVGTMSCSPTIPVGEGYWAVCPYNPTWEAVHAACIPPNGPGTQFGDGCVVCRVYYSGYDSAGGCSVF